MVLTLILSSDRFAIAYGVLHTIAECIHLTQPEQRRSLKGIIMYYIKLTERNRASLPNEKKGSIFMILFGNSSFYS
ncbi:MAG: hypothetical protein V7L14_07250 [Nostoc sp.]|uniref:hypothetical protein n=1 Tax=Nostoc sp. TaxID=1180 RepID=UPI002FF82C8F